MDDKQFLYLTIEVSENQTQVVKEVVDEIESYDWHVVAYDLNPHELYENRYLMTVYMEKEEKND